MSSSSMVRVSALILVSMSLLVSFNNPQRSGGPVDIPNQPARVDLGPSMLSELAGNSAQTLRRQWFSANPVEKAVTIVQKARLNAKLDPVLESAYSKYGRILERFYFGQYDEAVSGLNELGSQFEGLSGNALFSNCGIDRSEPRCELGQLVLFADILRARIALKQNHAERAIDILEGLYPPEELVSYVEFLKADAYLERDDYSDAARLLSDVSFPDDRVFQARSRTQRALAVAKSKNWDDALSLLGSVIEIYPDSPFRPELEYQRARALEGLGRVQAASKQYKRIQLEYPQHSAGELAKSRLNHLRRAGMSIPKIGGERLFKLARQLRLRRQYEASLEWFETLSQRSLDRSMDIRIDVQKALIAFARQNNKRAIAHLEHVKTELKNQDVKDVEKQLVHSLLSQLYARLGYDTKAKKALLNEYDDVPREVRQRHLAEFYRSNGKLKKAYETFDELDPHWWHISWKRAWFLYRTNQYADAVESLDRLQRIHRGEPKLKYRYWMARALQKSGKTRRAEKIFRDLSRKAPYDYYGIQASNRIKDLERKTTNALSFKRISESLTRPTKLAVFEKPIRDRPRGKSLLHRLRLEPKRPGSESLEIGESKRDLEPCPSFRVSGEQDGIISDILGSDSCSSPGANKYVSTSRRLPAQKVDWPSASFDWKSIPNGNPGGSYVPFPGESSAYTTQSNLFDLFKFQKKRGELFSRASEAHALYMTGFKNSSRRQLRKVFIEIKALGDSRIQDSEPKDLSHLSLNEYYIDKSRGQTGFWGVNRHEPIFPAPRTKEQRQRQLERQRQIIQKRRVIKTELIAPLKEVGNHHIVRRLTSKQSRYPHSFARSWSFKNKKSEWSRLYPKAYSNQVLRSAHKHKISPYLVWSLMGIESNYNPDSVSVANAIGVMQMIPSTGKKVASHMGESHSFEAYQLLKPAKSIEYGAYYFSQLIEKFRGQHLLAFPAYNAGPHRVASWLEKRGHLDADEFIEDIPFKQAELYTKKAVESVARYLEIYESNTTFALGNELNTNYRAFPDF